MEPFSSYLRFPYLASFFDQSKQVHNVYIHIWKKCTAPHSPNGALKWSSIEIFKLAQFGHLSTDFQEL